MVCSQCAASDAVGGDRSSSRRRGCRTSWLPSVNIGSIARHSPGSMRPALGAGAVVGDLRLLVHLRADAVADEGANDAIAGGAGDVLDRARDVGEVVARLRRRDARVHGARRRIDETPHFWRDLADDEGARRVAVPAVDDRAGVDRHDLPFAQTASVRGRRGRSRSSIEMHSVWRNGAMRPGTPMNDGVPPASRIISSAIASSSSVVTPGLTSAAMRSRTSRDKSRRRRPSSRSGRGS